MKKLLLPSTLLLLAACGGQPPRPFDAATAPPAPVATATTTPKPPASGSTKRGGGYYLDDGPGDTVPQSLDAIPDAAPRAEPLHRFANNPYSALGKDYVPQKEVKPYKAKGIASWYGRRYHGQKTSSGEPYDMYAMTAAHPTLPIPSYVRVTNPANGKSVVLRVNDRGPFHADRLIDLSYTAAWKLGYIDAGSTQVEVEAILPGKANPIVRSEPSAAPASVTPAADNAEVRGHYVQLGAFGNRDNADAFNSRLVRELDWLGDKLRIQTNGAMHRIQAGPYRDRAEAESVAERIRVALGYKPALLQR